MHKLILTAVAVNITLATSASAMTIQPDPQNPTGYIVSGTELADAENRLTLDPMYDVWAKALETRDNSIVEAIVPNAASNPVNVKRV
ncbi:carbohydrate-binding protein, partial [Pseudoalteromonas ruthenica]